MIGSGIPGGVPSGFCIEHEGFARGSSGPEDEELPWACDNWGRFPQLDCRIWWYGEYVTTSDHRY